MAETPVGGKNLWMFDDSNPYDLAELKDIDISPELQKKIDAIFDNDTTSAETQLIA